MDYKAKLSSDTPVVDPINDAYGYAGFAKNLAQAIRVTPSPRGLVMAVNGPWGAGKSSLLNFIKHDLISVHEEQCPILIDFNPWWFNGRDQLAAQLLSQFSSKLSNESKSLLKIGALMAEYSSALSKAVALWTGIPWIDKPVNVLLKLLKRKPREVPQVKEEIVRALQKSKRRVLCIIDDLDRLTPDEMRELFKTIKALADFPNVIYLLSFDKKVVVDALTTSLGVDGNAYLEKIVQAPFSLPIVDRQRLQNKLFADLSALMDALPQAKFSTTYWGNVYHDGIDHYIRKPRDVVRLINALAVTYPPVAGEVNPVDYIALECLRVFMPSVHATIRDNRGMFVGLPETAHGRDSIKKFHGDWLDKVTTTDQAAVKALVEHLFPKFAATFGGMGYARDFLGVWHQELRACSSELFNLYFQFSISQDYLTQAELTNLLALSADIPVLIETLRSARNVIRSDGRSKASDFVDRIRKLKADEITPKTASNLLTSIFALKEDLLVAADQLGGSMSIPTSWRMNWLIGHLLERIPQAERAELLLHCIQQGNAYSTMVHTVGRLEESVGNPDKTSAYTEGIDTKAVAAMKAAVLKQLEAASIEDLLATSDTASIMYVWSQWGAQAQVKSKLEPVSTDDGYLVKLLEKYLNTGSSHAMGDRVARTTYHLDPRALEPYFDLETIEKRLQPLVNNLDKTSRGYIAVDRFLKGMVRLRAGKTTNRETIEELLDDQ